jgi:NAD(P)-dependent dehydrogenase (short-subunit alcohol dehydrogenase family)
MAILTGKVAVVTGGAGAIGRAACLLLAEQGASVVVNDVGSSLDGSGSDAGPAQKVVSEIVEQGGKSVPSIQSITDPDGANAIIRQAVESFGRIDIIIHIAGILRDVIFHKMGETDWLDVLHVHLNGGFNISRAAAPYFREQQSGAFLFTTSTSGLIGNFAQANYMAAKMGLVGLSRGIALDMQRFNVRSNCIAPLAWSRMISSLPTATEQERLRVERLRRMTPEKVAPLIAYLVSDAAAEISGQIFGVRSNEVYLFNQSRPIRTLHTSDGWTPETLAEMMPALSASLTPLQQSSEFFTWDPV